MIELREATRADRPSILALRARCFPGEDVEKLDPRFWDWEFGGGRMFIAEDRGRAVAHLGFIAQPYRIGDESVQSLLAVDAMTDPEYRGQQLFGRVAAFARAAIATTVRFSGAWQIRKQVAQGMRVAGWEEDDGARVLIRPFTLASGGGGEPVTDVAWMSKIAAAYLERQQHATGRRVAHLDRTPQWLAWRYFENPLWRYEVTATEHAWLVTRRTRLKGIDTLAIVDIAWTRSRDAAALLARALRNSRETIAATLVTSHHPAYWWFLRRGFLPGPHRFRFLITGDVRAKWSLMWGDTDHL